MKQCFSSVLLFNAVIKGLSPTLRNWDEGETSPWGRHTKPLGHPHKELWSGMTLQSYSLSSRNGQAFKPYRPLMTYTRWTCEVQRCHEGVQSWRLSTHCYPNNWKESFIAGLWAALPSIHYTRANTGLGLFCKLWHKFRIVVTSG